MSFVSFFKRLITSDLAILDHSFLFQRLLPILSRAKHEFSTVSGGFFSPDSIFHHCRGYFGLSFKLKLLGSIPVQKRNQISHG